LTPTGLNGLGLAEAASEAAESEKSVRVWQTRRDLREEEAMGEAKVPSCPGRRKGIDKAEFLFSFGIAWALGPRGAKTLVTRRQRKTTFVKNQRLSLGAGFSPIDFSGRIVLILARVL
jgi:hypothetical protein